MKTRLLIIFVISLGILISFPISTTHATEPPPPECVKNRENPDSVSWKYNHAVCELDLYRDENTGKINENYIPRYFYSEITRIFGDEWSRTDRNWGNNDGGFNYPDIVCSEIIYDGLTYTVSLEMPNAFTLQQINFHNFEEHPEDEFDIDNCHKYYPPVNDMHLRDAPPIPEQMLEDEEPEPPTISDEQDQMIQEYCETGIRHPDMIGIPQCIKNEPDCGPNTFLNEIGVCQVIDGGCEPDINGNTTWCGPQYNYWKIIFSEPSAFLFIFGTLGLIMGIPIVLIYYFKRKRNRK